jgi:hypothetical protein
MKKLLIIPYGTPRWSAGSENIREITARCRNLDVMYLLPMWGLVNMQHFHTSMLSGYAHLPEHRLIQNTAVMVRSWLHHKGPEYSKIILMNYGKGMKFWTKGAAKTPVVKKIKVIRYLPKGDRILHRRIVWNYNNEAQKSQ